MMFHVEQLAAEFESGSRNGQFALKARGAFEL
jgi:hypothetical protein